MALVFVAGSFYNCGSTNRPQAGQEGVVADTVAATVAGKPVSASALDAAIDGQAQQMAQYGLPAEQSAQFIGSAIAQPLRGVAISTIAEKKGVMITDQSVRDFVAKQFQTAVDAARAQLIQQKKLKEGATEAELDAAIKKEFKRSLTEIKTEQNAKLDTDLKDPKTRGPILSQVAEPVLVASLASKSMPSADEAKKSFDELTVKRILLKETPGKDIKQEATKVYEEIKGGLSFEEAMDRYSRDIPQPKKRVSENTTTVTGKQLNEESYRPLATLKDGDVAEPYTSAEGTIIYKRVSTANKTPKEFDKDPDKFRLQLAEEKVRLDLSKELDDVLKTGIVWKAKGYEALYKLATDTSNADPKLRETQLKGIVDLVKPLMKTAFGGEKRAASLAYLASMSNLWNTAGADKTKLRPDRIDSILGYLETSEDAALRMQLVDLYLEAKETDAASDSLVRIAASNTDYTPKGQQLYGDVTAKLATIKAAGSVPAAAITAVEAELTRWRKEKIAYEKDLADQRKAEAAAAKKKPAESSLAPKQ